MADENMKEVEQETSEETTPSPLWHTACGRMRQAVKNPMASRIGLLLLAILVGSAVKIALVPRVTIGFQDYTLKSQSALYDLDAAEKRVASQAQASGAAPSAGIPTGGSCGGL